MPDLAGLIPLIFAENAPAADPNAGAANSLGFLPIVIVIGLWFYLLMVRPQQQQEKKRKQMLSALKKNDKVLTSGGMYGTVVAVDAEQDRVTIRIDDDRGVKVAFTKASIARIIDAASEKAPESV